MVGVGSVRRRLCAGCALVSAVLLLPGETFAQSKSFCEGYARDYARQHSRGKLLGGAAFGAVGGAIIGGIAGSPGTGAAIGGAAGALVGGGKKRRDYKTLYRQAYKRCMSG